MFNKKIALLMLSIFVLSNIGSVQQGFANVKNLDNIKPGDTVYYKVSKYNYPLQNLLAGQTSSIDLSQVQLDLTGSQFGVKVMNTYSTSGQYLLDVFVILGKQIVVPFPSNTDPTVTSIFGNTMTIPAGTGISIGAMLPGSNLVSFISSGSNSGIPVYIESSNTGNYKTYLDGLSSSSSSYTTTDGSDTFQTVCKVNDNTGSFTITLVWFKTGNDAGFFKSFDLTGTVPNSQGQSVNVAVTFSFDHRVNNPLPSEATDGKTQYLQIESAGIDLSWDGTYFNDLMNGFNQTAYNETKSQLQSMVGQNFMRYTFNIFGNTGMYYATNLDLYDFNTNGYVSDLYIQWFDGFTGTPDGYNPSCAPNCYNANSPTGFLVPFLAPAITPDWDIWQTNMNTYQALSGIVTNTLTSSSVTNNILDYGLKVNTLTNLMQLRSKDQFMYFYDELNAKMNYDASQALSSNRPSNFDGTEKASVDAAGNLWSSYTNKGLIAGYGVKFNVTVSVTNFPLSSNTGRGDGTLTLGIVFKLRNDAFNSLPDGVSATPVPGSPFDSFSTSNTNILNTIPSTPGFEMVSLLIAIVAITVFSRKKRN